MELHRCTFRVDPEVMDALSGCLFEAGVEGLEENLIGDELTTYLPTREAVDALLVVYDEFKKQVALVYPEIELADPEVELADSSWQKTWREALEPAPLADDWVLRPTTRAPAPAGEKTIWFEPNESFGSGSHPTTRLMVETLVEIGASEPGLPLFDVGSGTGVLSLVALRAGFSRALAVDVSELAVEATQKSAQLNQLADRIDVKLGSADATLEKFPVVVANIDARTLVLLAPELLARLHGGGRLLLAGLLDEDRDDVLGPYLALGASLLDEKSERGWTRLVLDAPVG